MIEARHDRVFARVFALYASVVLRRRVSGIWVRSTLPPTRSPLLVAAQNVDPLDPMVLFHLSRVRFGGTHFAMMEEPSLLRHASFRRLGGFGIDRTTRAGTIEATRYALARLHEPAHRVWMFPQGRLVPADTRPLECDRGATWLAAHARVPTVAVAIRHEHLASELPRVFVSFSEPVMIEPKSHDDDPVCALLALEADRLSALVAKSEWNAFDLVLRGRRSTWADRGN
jgi:1-acyl-sn-glycerol-3-phosphate acyltransferase